MSTPLLAICPETKVKTPLATEKFIVPSLLVASNTISLRAISAFWPMEKTVSSTNNKPTEPSAPVSIWSP